MTSLFVIIAFLLMAAAFAAYLVKHDQGEHEPAKALWTAFGFGIVGVFIAAALEYVLLPDVIIGDSHLGRLALIAFGIGAIEELAKCLLLMRFLYPKRYFNEHTNGVIYFALAGLGFGLPENILYTFQYGAKTGLARVILTPLFHAATTGLIGYVLARRKLDGVSKAAVVTTIVAAILVHAVYDFGLFSTIPVLVIISVMMTVALGAGLFLLLIRARTLDQAQGLSVVGHNSFCRTCGHANPKHNLYCSQCGNRA